MRRQHARRLWVGAILLQLLLGLPARASEPGATTMARRSAVARRLDGSLIARAPRGAKRLLLRRHPHDDAIRGLSTASLLLAGARETLGVGARLGPLAISFSGVGSLGLGVCSLKSLFRARSAEARVDAAHGVAWSLQGLTGLSLLGSGGVMRWAGTVSGVLGGVLQTAVGLYRLGGALRPGGRERCLLGALDVGAGLCWTASTCGLGVPFSLGGYLAFSGVRLAFEHRAWLRAAAAGIKGWFRERAGAEQGGSSVSARRPVPRGASSGVSRRNELDLGTR